MAMYFFRNRLYQVYFELSDACAGQRCPICALLSKTNRQLIADTVGSLDRKAKIKFSLRDLCLAHRTRIKQEAADEPFLALLKAAIKDALQELARPRQNSVDRWKPWRRSHRPRCPLCGRISSRERFLCGALIDFLKDTEFWKTFQCAAPLCLNHLQKSLSIEQNGAGLPRLIQDQRAKLNELLNDLIRFEATGSQSQSKSAALAWLADLAGGPIDVDEDEGPFAEVDLAPQVSFHVQPEVLDGESPDVEQLIFENEKLHRQVRDLMNRLNELESRGASLHYRVARLSEDNKRLEMGYTGANTQADGLKQLVRDLREQIESLKAGSGKSKANTAL